MRVLKVLGAWTPRRLPVGPRRHEATPSAERRLASLKVWAAFVPVDRSDGGGGEPSDATHGRDAAAGGSCLTLHAPAQTGQSGSCTTFSCWKSMVRKSSVRPTPSEGGSNRPVM